MYLYLEDFHSRKSVWNVVCEMSAILSRAQLNSLVSWGQPAACALVTSMSNTCGNYKVVVISRAWVHPGSQENMSSGVQWMKTTNWNVLTLLKLDRFLQLKVHIPIFFFSENYCSSCTIIAKNVLDLAEGTMVLILWQDVATGRVRPKTNTTPFEVTRQDKIRHWTKIPDDTAAGQPGWSIEVAEM